VRICARQPAEIAAVADWLAGDEERHRRAAWHTVLRYRSGGCQARQSQDGDQDQGRFHAQLPVIIQC
jgi:hypothetical protein